MVRVRFAPSPTGPLHIGGVRTALFNYLFAKNMGGKCILRIEDTDQSRFVEGAENYIMDSLDWCGIKFDEGIREGGKYGPYRQSERRKIYEEYAKILIKKDKVYFAFDTAEELDNLRKEYENEGKTFIYNHSTRMNLKNSLSLPKEEIDSLIKNNHPYILRFKTPENRILKLYDEVRGEISFNTNESDDKVLMKADGLPTYHLANIVDDHLMEITHVIRGEEWLPSLPLHFLLYEAFEWAVPKFSHLPLILKPNGKGKLSKRDGDQGGFPIFPTEWHRNTETFRGYREDGYFPEAVINMLALLGWNPGTEQEIFSTDELFTLFSLSKVGKSASRFDPEKTKWFNHQYLIKKSDNEIADLFTPFLIEKNIDYKKFSIEKICSLVKERVNFIHELWQESFFFFVSPNEFDENFRKKAIKEGCIQIMTDIVEIFNNTNDFSAQNTEKLVANYVEKKQIGFGKVGMPLRYALIGTGKGPHIFDVVEIIGKEETIARINKIIEENK